MPPTDEHSIYIPRRLTRIDDDGNIQEIKESELSSRSLPIVVLGEPGMGKTRLLEQLANDQKNWRFIRAGTIVRNPQKAWSPNPKQILVIDALDEVAALQEGDPLHNVLKALGEINYPNFVMSCRSADWRSAIAKFDIAEDYSNAPEEWILEPITRDEALDFLLGQQVRREIADELVLQLEARNLFELFRNPLTLSLLANVVKTPNYTLPKTKADLFAQATDFLRLEMNNRHADKEFAQMAKEQALDAAGAAMAGLLLTGKDNISIGQNSSENSNNLPISEVTTLPNGEYAKALLHSRLFRIGEFHERGFVPLHRTVAEYLGARWLARRIRGNRQATARFFALITADGLVPASLRGLHAWLAHWSPELARIVIENDPYGLLRYGDADGLDVVQGRELLAALQRLEEEQPYFRAGDWAHYSAKGLMHEELVDVMRAVITSSGTGYQLRTLLLEALKDTSMADKLGSELEAMIRNSTLDTGERLDAGLALAGASDYAINWPQLIDDLREEENEDSPHLAIGLILEIGIEKFSDWSIAKTVLAAVGLLGSSSRRRGSAYFGSLHSLAQAIPDDRTATMLDCLADEVAAQRSSKDSDRESWEIQFEIGGFSRKLIARQLEHGIDDPLRLWRWLEALEDKNGYDDETRKKIAKFLKTNSNARVAIQSHFLFSTASEHWRLGSLYTANQISSGLILQPEDIIFHLQQIAERNDRSDRYREVWRTLVAVSRGVNGIPDDVRAVATPYALGDDELTNFLDPKPSPSDLDRQNREKMWEAQRKRQEKDKKRLWDKHRTDFAAHKNEMRSGELGWIASPAKVYFGLFSDVDTEKDPPDRIRDWLGPELQQTALAGFEATLFRDDIPTPEQVANSYAVGKYWNYIHPILAGLVERWRNGRDFSNVPIDVIMTGRLGASSELIEQHAKLEGFEDALEALLRTDQAIFERFLRTWLEPHLSVEHQHVMGLYKFARDVSYRPLSTKLAAEWLGRFPNLPFQTESELIYCLATAPVSERNSAWSELMVLAEKRRQVGFQSDEHGYLWQSVCFLVDFESNGNWLRSGGDLKPEFIWSIRSILNYQRHIVGDPLPISSKQLAWIVRVFRRIWPRTDRPGGVTSGDVNPWDAVEFIDWAISQLASKTSDNAMEQLTALLNAPKDSYTTRLKDAVANQRRSRMEASFGSISLTDFAAALRNDTPRSADEVQVIVLDEIAQLQKELRGNATNTVEHFYDHNGRPKTENECRNLLLDLLRRLPFGIQTSPEEAMPGGTRADAGFRLDNIKVPLETKGQWHRNVWEAANSQLGQLYSIDHQAHGRGIYVVFWFGRDAPPGKRLRRPPDNRDSPQTSEQMKTMLERRIQPALRGSIAVFVLDLSKSN